MKAISLVYDPALDLTLVSHTIRSRAGRVGGNNCVEVNETAHFPYSFEGSVLDTAQFILAIYEMNMHNVLNFIY